MADAGVFYLQAKKDLRSPWTAEVLGNSGEITD